jgi:predicted dehydrogenase
LLPLSHWQHDPSQGGGRIIGEACHFIDFLTFLVGAPPRRVQALGLPDSNRYRQDNVVLTLEFPDGSLGTVTYLANGDRAFPKERLEVFGGGRVAVLDDFRRLDLVSGGRRRSQNARLRQDKGHRAEWQVFVAAIAAGGPPPIAYDQLFAATLASFAAVDSLRTGQAMNIEPLRLD